MRLSEIAEYEVEKYMIGLISKWNRISIGKV